MRLAAKRHGIGEHLVSASIDGDTTLRYPEGSFEVVRLGEGDPLVLIPGLAGGPRLLVPLARRLAMRRQVIIIGLRGDSHPLASKRTHDITDHARDVARIIESLEIHRPEIFGVSFGGAVALELAIERPDLVRSLTLQGADSSFPENVGVWFARRALERFPLPSNNAFVNQFFNLLHGGKPDERTKPTLDFLVRSCWSTDQSEIAHRLRILNEYDVSDRLWRIDAPTLVLAGTKDVVVAPRRQKRLANAVPFGLYQPIEGAGHIAFLTHSRQVARAVLGRDLEPSRVSV